MTDDGSPGRAANAWLVREAQERLSSFPYADYVVELVGERSSYGAIGDGDWVLAFDPTGRITRFGRVMRVRSDLLRTTLYFDKFGVPATPVSLSDLGVAVPAKAGTSRIQWESFVGAVAKCGFLAPDDVPLVTKEAYLRELLQLAVTDDLLGPANGPREQILDMGVRDRYLVGKLAPRETARGGIEGLVGPLAPDQDMADEPEDLEVHTGRHEPGAEFDGATGRIDAEAEAADEVDASSNQSLVPSSLGLTICVDGEAKAIEVDARWGRYVRVYDHEHTKTINKKIRDEEGNVVRVEPQEIKLKVWQRVPCGGALKIDLTDGVITHRVPDEAQPEVRVQGTVRSKNQNGDRLVTLFLVNSQEELEDNKDAAWVFQPVLSVRALGDTKDKAIFRRRAPVSSRDDEERGALEMIYRRQVEFAVGHGISVHAEVDPDNAERAVQIRTEILPQYEVPVSETPGARPEDRPAMRAMTGNGHLDMEVLAGLPRTDLVAALSSLAADYGAWITEQTGRIAGELDGHEEQAKAALDRCSAIKKRLEEGLAVLANEKDDKALTAFRFANRAMARQRVHSLYALARRRGEERSLADFQQRKYHSWRPFQLAFILLSIPALADPSHKDRTQPVDAFADLLWFPTGGGKTEAYLGVSAFAMVIRRLQGNLGGYDSSRGLTVIMRYTLRLLTLQQFQRASALMCAMEVMRQEAREGGDSSLGTEPFTIGLWVGNKVTPGSTAESHRAIQDIRDPDKFDAGGTSPAQLTSCPWCGCEISPEHDVEISTAARRTAMRRVAVFPPHGLDVSDNFFSIQRPISMLPGRRYMGVCSPGSSRPAMLIRTYTAFLTASQALFDRFGQAADPYLTTVGYFNSLRELGGMRRLAEDDVQTRSYRVKMSNVDRPGLEQRSVKKIRELTSRVSSRDIPKYLDELEIKFKSQYDPAEGRYVTRWKDDETHAIDVVLATNMLSVGVDVNRLGLMVVNGQPKGTAEYIQATSRVGRSFPGLVCTVLTWARPRDLSHYETFEHYHATFYKHVEAQSVTPFSPRAMDRGLTGTLLSVMRLDNTPFNPNPGAGALDKPDGKEAVTARDLVVKRAWNVSQEASIRDLALNELKARLDQWAGEAAKGGRTLAYEKKGPNSATTVPLLQRPGIKAWDNFTVPMSMREVEPGVRLVMSTARFGGNDPSWGPQATDRDRAGDES